CPFIRIKPHPLRSSEVRTCKLMLSFHVPLLREERKFCVHQHYTQPDLNWITPDFKCWGSAHAALSNSAFSTLNHASAELILAGAKPYRKRTQTRRTGHACWR